MLSRRASEFDQRGTACQCSEMPNPTRPSVWKRARPSLTNVTPSRRGILVGQIVSTVPSTTIDAPALSVASQLHRLVQQRVRRVVLGRHRHVVEVERLDRRAGSSPCRGTCRRPSCRTPRRARGRHRSSSRTSSGSSPARPPPDRPPWPPSRSAPATSADPTTCRARRSRSRPTARRRGGSCR